ncbi:hypothetical protein ACTOJ1_001219 [Shigella flexneri]
MSEDKKVRVEVVRDKEKMSITGFVGDDDILRIHNHIGGKWAVGHSSTLGSDFNYARLKAEAIKLTFEKFDELVSLETKK